METMDLDSYVIGLPSLDRVDFTPPYPHSKNATKKHHNTNHDDNKTAA